MAPGLNGELKRIALMKKIKKLDFDSVNDISQGSFDILLNKKL